MRTAGTLEALALFVGDAIGSIADLFNLQGGQVSFDFLGYSLPPEVLGDGGVTGASATAGSATNALKSAASILRNAIETGADDFTIQAAGATVLGGILSSSGAFSGLATAVTNASGLASDPDAVRQFAAKLPTLLFDFATVRRIEVSSPELASVAVLLQVLKREFTLVDPISKFALTKREWQLDDLSSLLADPSGLIQSAYHFGQPTFDGQALLSAIAEVIRPIAAEASFFPSGPIIRSDLFSIDVASATPAPQLRIANDAEIPDGLDVGLTITPLWSARVKTTGTLPAGVDFFVSFPDQVRAPSTTVIEGEWGATLSRGDGFVLFGETGGSGLRVGNVDAKVSLKLAWDAVNNEARGGPAISIALRNGQAVIDLSKGDGFLSSLAPGGRIQSDFEVVAEFSIASGLTFEAGASLQIKVPLHVSLGNVKVDNLNIRLPIGSPDRPGLPIDFATALTTTFGPFTMLIDGVGLKLDVTFGSGNLGIANIEPDFLPPTGIGLSLALLPRTRLAESCEAFDRAA